MTIRCKKSFIQRSLIYCFAHTWERLIAFSTIHQGRKKRYNLKSAAERVVAVAFEAVVSGHHLQVPSDKNVNLRPKSFMKWSIFKIELTLSPNESELLSRRKEGFWAESMRSGQMVAQETERLARWFVLRLKVPKNNYRFDTIQKPPKMQQKSWMRVEHGSRSATGDGLSILRQNRAWRAPKWVGP